MVYPLHDRFIRLIRSLLYDISICFQLYSSVYWFRVVNDSHYIDSAMLSQQTNYIKLLND
jgi:hypothetical protein